MDLTTLKDKTLISDSSNFSMATMKLPEIPLTLSLRKTKSSLSFSTGRSGGIESYSCNKNSQNYIDKNASQRGYRVVGMKEVNGKQIVFDIHTGDILNCGSGMNGQKLSYGVTLYESQKAALGEKFGLHQVVYVQILII